MDADEPGNLSDGEERAFGVGLRTASGVVPDGESLARHSEDDLRADHVTGQSNRMYLRA